MPWTSPHDNSDSRTGTGDRHPGVRRAAAHGRREHPGSPYGAAPGPDLRRRRGQRLLPAGGHPARRRRVRRDARCLGAGGDRHADRLHGRDPPAGAARRPDPVPALHRHPAPALRARPPRRGVRPRPAGPGRGLRVRRGHHGGRPADRPAGGGDGGPRPPRSGDGHAAERVDRRDAAGPDVQRHARRTAGLARPVPGGRGRGAAARPRPRPRPAGHGPAAAPAVPGAAGGVPAPVAHRARTAPFLPLPGDRLRRFLGRLDLCGPAPRRSRVRAGRPGGGHAGPGRGGDHGLYSARRARGGPQGVRSREPGLPARGPPRGRGPRAGRSGRDGGGGRAGRGHTAAGRRDAVRHGRQPGPGLRPASRWPQQAQHRLHDLRLSGRQRRLVGRGADPRPGRLAGRVRAGGLPRRPLPRPPPGGVARARAEVPGRARFPRGYSTVAQSRVRATAFFQPS
ncbi:hypothetical protein SLAV_35275 [Streptomyces lavendulae subsp. lavendulae]|uniref:Uncharacterized protein n=1 Tax=Streptomyces lavendulae subsp. lavendulae TaxID=58340 RepID=A0A2K8PT58_STRLA|nr:hypothetical protein SLAV_35275 [Streptomyces lavendulae subsp. lavendulae]QUQ58650.1 hypothetical protein SLLC_33450 [Streptomyces lavendulae subsp. lavendulae]